MCREKIRKIKISDFKDGLTNGVFDILHKGHIDLLKFCKTISKKVILELILIKVLNLIKVPKDLITIYEKIKKFKKYKLVDKIFHLIKKRLES